MAEDMASNGNDAQRHYQDAIQAQLGERVTNLGRRVTDIEGEMRAGFRQIESSIAGLSSTLADRARPQWQAIGVALLWPERYAELGLKSGDTVYVTARRARVFVPNYSI